MFEIFYAISQFFAEISELFFLIFISLGAISHNNFSRNCIKECMDVIKNVNNVTNCYSKSIGKRFNEINVPNNVNGKIVKKAIINTSVLKLGQVKIVYGKNSDDYINL